MKNRIILCSRPKGSFKCESRTLRTKFQDIALMSITDILYDMSFKRMTEHESAVKYCAEYENALNFIKGMIEENS